MAFTSITHWYFMWSILMKSLRTRRSFLPGLSTIDVIDRHIGVDGVLQDAWVSAARADTRLGGHQGSAFRNEVFSLVLSQPKSPLTVTLRSDTSVDMVYLVCTTDEKGIFFSLMSVTTLRRSNRRPIYLSSWTAYSTFIAFVLRLSDRKPVNPTYDSRVTLLGFPFN